MFYVANKYYHEESLNAKQNVLEKLSEEELEHIRAQTPHLIKVHKTQIHSFCNSSTDKCLL